MVRLLHFLQTMFYGIYPTDASKHVYAPHTGRTLEGRLVFRRADGGPPTRSRVVS